MALSKNQEYEQIESSNGPQPIRGDRGASILGPRNVPLERENPDLLTSPTTDAGTIPNLKFSFAAARNRITLGGWGREVTARELPVATTMAGVNMRLKPGGIRELHWHKEAEWAYMLAGRARITAVDAQGRNFIDDVGVGDLWNFPAGIPHSIQGLEDGCEFLLVFDDGNFSENETFLISDWFAHTPRKCWLRTSEWPSPPSPVCRGTLSKRCGSSQERCPARWPETRSRRRRAVYLWPTATGCWRRSPSRLRGARSESSIRPTSRPRVRLQRPWWSLSPAPCASCTGTPIPMSGNTTSADVGA